MESLCLLDATYRTTQYSLPLIFLAVKNNVGFTVVAEVVVQYATKEAITEELKMVLEWSAQDGWECRPKVFMTHLSESEIPWTEVSLCWYQEFNTA